MGYKHAGFDEIVGVDIMPRKNYPFEFHQGDAIEFLTEHGHEFDFIHASPPCQAFSEMTRCRPGVAETYPDLVQPTREALQDTGKPWVMENVVGSPLRVDLWLCGQMVGLELYRHRVFEMNFPVVQPDHPKHVIPASRAGHWTPGTIMSVSGNIYPIAKAREVMEIDWTNRRELGEAIPPRFSRYIGIEYLKNLDAGA